MLIKTTCKAPLLQIVATPSVIDAVLVFLISFLQTPKNFTDNDFKRLNTTEDDWESLHRSAFDAVWTVALVLKYTEEMRLNQSIGENFKHENCSNFTGSLVPLNEFNYSNAYMGCVMKNNFYKVNFTGVSVRLI